MTVDYPDWMPTSQQMLQTYADITGQLASLIATGSAAGSPGGVPLLTYVNTIQNLSAQAFTAGTPQSFPSSGTFSINQIGYEGFIGISTAGATATVCHVHMVWKEAGNTVDVSDFWFYAGTTGSNHFIFFNGPTRGNQLVITITCLTNNCTINASFMSNSRVYTKDTWRTSAGTFVSAAGSGQVPFDMFGNVLAANNSVSCPATTTQTYTLPLWVGRVILQGSTASGQNDMQCWIINAADSTSAILFNAFSTSQGEIPATELVLPRSQCNLMVRNNNAAAQNLSVMAVLAEY